MRPNPSPDPAVEAMEYFVVAGLQLREVVEPFAVGCGDASGPGMNLERDDLSADQHSM
jgi:hypothetical protein